jgi:SAM-dependent methyltransferase
MYVVCFNLTEAKGTKRIEQEEELKDPRTIGHRLTARHRFLCKMSGGLEGESILDLGCGFGWFEAFALENGCGKIIGIDRDEKLITRARREVPGAEFILHDATEFLTGVGSFNVVVMFDFIEHLTEAGVVDMLLRVRGLLEPEGRLLLSVPCYNFLSNSLDPAFYLGHRHYRFQDLERILNDDGFEVSRVIYAGGLWEQLSLIWLYIFKWVFRREMPFADFLERKRSAEYEAFQQQKVGRKAYVTMFVEAVTDGALAACEL